MSKLIILIGTIGVGKSTVSKVYAKKGYVVVSRDSFRYMIKAGQYCFDPLLEPAIKSSNLLTIEEFCKINSNIIVDECCVDTSLRKSIIDIGKKYNYQIVGIVMPRLTMEDSVNRRMQDPHGTYDRDTYEKVWKMFDKAYEEPRTIEGFNYLIYLDNDYNLKLL